MLTSKSIVPDLRVDPISPGGFVATRHETVASRYSSAEALGGRVDLELRYVRRKQSSNRAMSTPSIKSASYDGAHAKEDSMGSVEHRQHRGEEGDSGHAAGRAQRGNGGCVARFGEGARGRRRAGNREGVRVV